MSIRVYQLAKELELPTNELIAQLEKLGISIKGHMSSVDDEVAQKIKKTLKPEKPKKIKPQPTSAVSLIKIKPPPKKTIPKPITRVSVTTVAEAPQTIQVPSPEKIAIPTLSVSTAVQEAKVIPKKIILKKFPITVKEFAQQLGLPIPELIRRLMKKSVFATINQNLELSVVESVAKELECELELPQSPEEIALSVHRQLDVPEDLVLRAPVVTFMGHVDHGKTSLLDYIRKTRVAAKEAGGITQHIGAYEVETMRGRVTFLDTPGHEAFTALRARGANATDIVVLVIAADDGVMPQTIEAIDHARAAKAPIVVAINKCDLPNASPDRIKQKLAELELVPEDWGGKTITVGVSAKTGQGVDELLEMLLLEAEVLELKANPKKLASGVVIEAKLTGERGPVATILVKNGTLRLGDVVLCGTTWGKIRAMFDDRARAIEEAQPAKPVEVLGLSGVPEPGEMLFALQDLEQAKEITQQRQAQKEILGVSPFQRHVTLDDLYQKIKEGQIKELNLILKTDAQGSLEAIKNQLLQRLGNEEVKISVIHAATGDVNESDVMLAAASDAIILGFHVRVDFNAQAAAAREGVDLRTYDIIYELINAIRAAMEGLLEPEIEEKLVGKAEVRQIFKVTKVGTVAGCMVSGGQIHRKVIVRLVRGKDTIFEGRLGSLKRFKDDVREVQEGFECGLRLEGFNDIQEGDMIEAYERVEKERKLKDLG